MMYNLTVIAHLLCAIVFIGVVFFEVLILEGIRPYLPEKYMALVEEGIHVRARKVMPYFVAVLFLTGISMGYFHMSLLNWSPFSNSFGTLLFVKMLLAFSVLVHFILAMKHSVCGSMSSKRFKYTHYSVFFHMIAIVLLAKLMFFISW